MRDNPIQFAVVREDPDIELALVERMPADRRAALLVASGGCTALTLAARAPRVRLTLVDPNPAQLALVERKAAALRELPAGSPERLRRFGVGRDDPSSLNGCGNFESLFRGLRGLLDDLVLAEEGRRAVLLHGADPTLLLGHRYWPVAFRLFFSDALLEAMFGKDATQHAAPGSYPDYFRRVLERGLLREDVRENYLLHHVLLGYHVEGALPAYLEGPAPGDLELVQAGMIDAPPLQRFGLVSLSNIFDWMGAEAIEAVARRLCAECLPGTLVVIRQLNNRAPVERFFDGAFRFDDALAEALLERDRSLFYERLVVGVRAT